jgi:peroxiredoxin
VKDKVTMVAAGLVLLALLVAMSEPGRHTESPKPQEEVPNFAFELAGQRRELSDFRGKIVVLNFWATWCPPCVAEMPSLERLHQRFRDRGLVVLGVSVDTDAAEYQNFLRTYNITFPNYRDPEKRISTRYGTFMYPETYIIDRQGRLVRKVIGAYEWDSPDILDYFTRLLETRPAR